MTATGSDRGWVMDAEKFAIEEDVALGGDDTFEALSEQDITKLYRDSRSEFRALVTRAKAISRGTGGIRSTGNQMFYASALFTRIAVTATSIQELVPPDSQRHTHWDFSAVASLVRNLAECYFVFYFLCIEEIDEDERQARFLMMHLHDNFTRHRMLVELGLREGEDEAFAVNYADLEERIHQTAYFAKLPEKRQKVILKGDRTPFIQDDILSKIGMDREAFRGLYRLLSDHTHTGPMSFYRMGQVERGGGVEASGEKVYITIALGLAVNVLTLACDGILTVFPKSEKRGSKVTERGLAKHLEGLKRAQMNGEVVEP